MGKNPRIEREKSVRRMFSHISNRYILANKWMTWGQDTRWRHIVIDLAHLPINGRLLDIGTGTGDLAISASQMGRKLFTVGADFSLEMLQVGRQREGGGQIRWLVTNALELPFANDTFEAVVSGYLLRNVADVDRALAEQYRVLKWDGRMVCLDTTPPPGDVWHLPVRLYLKYAIPLIGGMISGDRKAYTYLAETTQSFYTAEELQARMVKAGFVEARFKRFMGGAMAILWGHKKLPRI